MDLTPFQHQQRDFVIAPILLPKRNVKLSGQDLDVKLPGC